MVDWDHELVYFQALRELLPDALTGSLSRPDPPDFLIKRDDLRLGVEITRFHLPPPAGKRPHQEQQSLKDRIVYLAEKLHRQAGGPVLYVGVFFDQKKALAKSDTRRLAEELANSVLNYKVPLSVTESAVEIPWRELPEGISAVQVHGSVDGKDRLWHADAGGWVAAVSGEHIQDILDGKARQAKEARCVCDELWLVIVYDWVSRAAPVELSGEAVSEPYVTSFDKVLWFLPQSQQAIELSGRGSAA